MSESCPSRAELLDRHRTSYGRGKVDLSDQPIKGTDSHGRAAVSEVRELGLVSVAPWRGQWPPHHRRDERRSEGAKEASNFEHTWLIYKHPILIRPRASVRVRPARRAEGTSEYSSQPFFERRRRRELAICPAGAGGTHFRNERDRPDDARYEIESGQVRTTRRTARATDGDHWPLSPPLKHETAKAQNLLRRSTPFCFRW